MGAHPRDPASIDAPFEEPPLGRPIRVAVLAEPPVDPPQSQEWCW
jgi:amidase